MDWLLRFLIGLPAREEDLIELKNTIPEIFDKEINADLIDQKYHLMFERFIFYYPDQRILLENIQKWMNNAKINERINTDISCEKVNCPYRTDSNNDKSDDFPLLFELIVSGMSKRKPPKDSFLDLVKKVHKNTEKIKEVIITDPYIYSDTGESGKEGGYNTTIEYLQTLGIEANDKFTLRLNPSPKKYNEQSKKIFESVLEKEFININYATFSSKYIFHDRLYLVKDGSGKLKGVFGPSLNGLTTNSIVLMGEIDNANTIKLLKDIFV